MSWKALHSQITLQSVTAFSGIRARIILAHRHRRRVQLLCLNPGDSEALMLDLGDGARRLQALEDYREHLQRPEEDISLLDCALLIAKHAHPQLDENVSRFEIERLADGVWDMMPDNSYPLRILQTINKQLYEVNGFRGNAENYYDPDNSCINKVLENRCGIPISMALVYMEVAQRCKFPMLGLNMPAHFMLTPLDPEVLMFIDPYHGGEICFLEEAEERLSKLLSPKKVKISPAILEDKVANAIWPRAFLGRMLNNLKGSYLATSNSYMCLIIQQYIRATYPEEPGPIRDEGVCLWGLGRHADCAECLRDYLLAAPNAEDAQQVRSLLEQAYKAMGDNKSI